MLYAKKSMQRTDVSQIRKFVDDGLVELSKLDLMMNADRIPVEMVDEARSTSDQKVWKPISSTVTSADIAALESLAGCRLPESFQEFLKYKHFFELWLPCGRNVCFYSHPIFSWKKQYQQMYSYDWVREDLIEQGYLPFADHDDWGLLCFNTKVSRPDNEYEIILVDHASAGDESSYKSYNSSFMEMVSQRLIYQD